MGFVQLIEFRTQRIDEVNQLLDEWAAATEGDRTAQRILLGQDRDIGGVYLEVVEFPSYEEAMRNSELPKTSEFAQRMAALCDDGPTFRNIEIIRSEDL